MPWFLVFCFVFFVHYMMPNLVDNVIKLVMWELILIPIWIQSFFFWIKPNVLPDLFSVHVIISWLLFGAVACMIPGFSLETMYTISFCISLPLVWYAIVNFAFICIPEIHYSLFFKHFLLWNDCKFPESSRKSTERCNIPYILTYAFYHQ